MTVVVIGAGVIGTAVARALARRGAEVRLLEMRAPGHGASWASAGILAPYAEARGDSPLLAPGERSLAMFETFIASVREESGRPVEYQRSGTLHVALSEEEEQHLRAEKDWLDSKHIACRWLANAALADFEPAASTAARAGLFIAPHAFVGVNALVSALAQAARFAGAVFESPVEALEVVATRNEIEVRAGPHSYAADHVVIAAGSWSSRIRIANVRHPDVRPVRGQILHLGWSGDNRPQRVSWSHDCYIVPWQDGTVLVGATVEEAGFDETTTAAGVAGLIGAATRLLPACATARLVDARAGLRPATTDGLPVIGSPAAAPRITFATGHYRNGILLAPLTASMVERWVLDGIADDMMKLMSPDRFASGRSTT